MKELLETFFNSRNGNSLAICDPACNEVFTYDRLREAIDGAASHLRTMGLQQDDAAVLRQAPKLDQGTEEAPRGRKDSPNSNQQGATAAVV